MSRLSQQIELARRQHAKDEIFVKSLLPYLRPGRVLEIGAGTGQLTMLLIERGYDAVPSEVDEEMMRYMRDILGMPAIWADALNLRSALGVPVPNLLAQGVSPLISPDLDVVEKAYRSCYDALEPLGRMVFIFPNSYGARRWSSVQDHRKIILKVGFTIKRQWRHQVLPARWYRRLPQAITHTLEGTLGVVGGIRTIFVLERPLK